MHDNIFLLRDGFPFIMFAEADCPWSWSANFSQSFRTTTHLMAVSLGPTVLCLLKATKKLISQDSGSLLVNVCVMCRGQS